MQEIRYYENNYRYWKEDCFSFSLFLVIGNTLAKSNNDPRKYITCNKTRACNEIWSTLIL